jgi:ATP-dependent RNA helicase RhlE
LRDIERTTRQRIPVAPLPANFMAAAEAFKRLKPAPKAQPERGERFQRSSTKADRRHDGEQRRNRNNGQQRHPHRGEGHPAHRAGAQDRNGQRRDEQRTDGARSSYRPEAYRESGQSDRRPNHAESGPRQSQPNQSREGYRPNGGQPKRKFGGRARPGGQHRARG